MTRDDATEPADALAHAAGRAALACDGVAYLRPSLVGLLRGTTTPRTRLPAASTPPSGIRVRRRTDTKDWHVEVHLAVASGHRALDVSRAVSTAVARAVREPGPAGGERPPVNVTVTVTVIAIL
ncbi:Asp23/Gls24 family envelope stress response protein [Actinomycetota bacterium Odt1-20B]